MNFSTFDSYLEVVVSIILVVHVFETYLSLRQHANFSLTALPSALQGKISADTFAKSQAYNKDKSTFGFVTSTLGLVQTLVIVLGGLMPVFWSWGSVLLGVLGVAETEMTKSLAFLVVNEGISYLLHVPFKAYGQFVVEERHGFNKQTAAGWIKDQVKTLLLQVVLGLPCVAALVYVIQWGGDLFWLYAWWLVMGLVLFFMTIYPTVIAPLFNKFEELPVGGLRDEIEKLAVRVDFPLTKLYVIDASQRSAHSNAYFYGFFGNKRIVLFDTLMNQVDTDGIVAIIGHELGHYKMNHVLKNMIVMQVHLAMFFYLLGFALTNEALFAAFGFSSRPTLIGLILFGFLYTPIEQLFSFGMHIMSRHFEYQADAFAVDLGLDALEPALIAIHKENLANMVPDPLYSTWHYTHPTLVERLDAMAILRNKKK